MCGLFVDGYANGVFFLFCWWLMLLLVMDVEFENTCTVEMFPGMFQDV